MISDRRSLLKRGGKLLAGATGLTATQGQVSAEQGRQATEVELRAPAAPAESFDEIGDREYVDGYGVSFPSAGRSFGTSYETLVMVPRTRYFSPGSDDSGRRDDDDAQENDVKDAIQIDVYPFADAFEYVNSEAERPIWEWDRAHAVFSGFKLTEGSCIDQNGEFTIRMREVTVGPATEFPDLLEREYVATMLVSES